MTNNVTKVDDENKTAELSNPGKLLRAYMQATGVFDAKQLAQDLDIPIRTIQRLRLEVATCANSANDARYGASSDCVIAPVAPDMALSASHVPARVEDNNITNYLEPTVVEVKCSEVLLRADAPKPKREAQGSRLDRDWQLPDRWRDWSRTTFPQTTAERVTAEAETFRDYWISAPGQRGRKADWEATWRNWCRKAFATAPLRPRAADGERQMSPWEAEKAAKHARIRAMLETVGGTA